MPLFFSTEKHKPSTYKYTTIGDDTTGTSADIWDPAAGKRLHLTGIIVSVDAAGEVQIRDKTGLSVIGVMDFNEKKATPFNFGSDLELPADHVLEATFTVDAGTGNAFITVIGHEH